MPEMNTIFSRGMPRVRHHFFHLGENRVVAAAGAPADILVAGEIGRLQDGKWEVNAHGMQCLFINDICLLLDLRDTLVRIGNS